MNKFLGVYDITEEDFSRRYNTDGESLKSIARSLCVDYETMRLRLHKSNIKVKSREQVASDAEKTGIMRKYNANYKFFDKLTPESSWVLGLIASDGNIVGDLSWWSLEIKDVDVLEQVKWLTEYTGNIRLRKDGRGSLVIRSKKMVKSLLELGITPAKSYALQFPVLPDGMIPHFLRGIFEGDGWFYEQETQHSTGLHKAQAGIVTASKDFAQSLMLILEDEGMNPRFNTRKSGRVEFPNGIVSERKETYIVRMSGYSVANFFKYIYDGTNEMTRMKRKYNKYSNWFNEYGIVYQGKRLNQTPSKAIRFGGDSND